MGLFGKKKKDEYDDIYGQSRSTAFGFSYGSRKVSSSFDISNDELSSIDPSKTNGDDEFPLVMMCRKCGVYMDFTPGDFGTGKWRCPICSVGVKEQTAYSQLERENDAFRKKWELDEEYPDVGYDPEDPEFDWSDL